MRDNFYELIKEAQNGKVIIDGEEWPIGFNSNIEGEYIGNDVNLSTLVINRFDDFIRLLNEYIELELKMGRKQVNYISDVSNNQAKALMAYLFVNMTTEDFLNPIEALRKRIAFLKDTTFSLLDEEIKSDVLDANVHLKQSIQSIYMETPYRMDISLEKNGEVYELPYVSYGIVKENNEKTCYIYSIMNHKELKKDEKKDDAFKKKMNRLLYKLNKGVYDSESQEYKDFKEGKSDYYPENISDVSPSFVLSLTIFLSMLQSKGIEKVKVVPYLPIRYLSRSMSATNAKDEEVRKERESRNNQIQSNATEKFIRTFRRVGYHMNGLKITSYPYENDEYLNIELNSKDKEINNEILQDVSDNIKGR